MKVLGTETVRTTAYHPQTNGQVERYNCTMATQLRHYIADDCRRWDELFPVLTLAYNSQPHRSTGIAPLELVIPRRIPNFSVRNLPPGTPLQSKGTLHNGSPLARKREITVKLRRQIPAVVEALRKTQQPYKRNFDTNVSPRNKSVRIEDYVNMKNQHRKQKPQRRAVGPYVVIDADDSTYVVNVGAEEVRVSSIHVTPDPRPTTAGTTPHPLLDGLDTPKASPPVTDDRLIGIRRFRGTYSAEVRWFDYGPKDDTWEPLDNLRRNLVIRYLRQKKKYSPGYSWSKPTPKARVIPNPNHLQCRTEVRNPNGSLGLEVCFQNHMVNFESH